MAFDPNTRSVTNKVASPLLIGEPFESLGVLAIVGIENFKTCGSLVDARDTVPIDGRFLSNSANNDHAVGYENVAVRPFMKYVDFQTMCSARWGYELASWS